MNDRQDMRIVEFGLGDVDEYVEYPVHVGGTWYVKRVFVAMCIVAPRGQLCIFRDPENPGFEATEVRRVEAIRQFMSMQRESS